MDKLELDLEKELSPLISKLRSNYGVLDELEAQRAPDPTKMDNVWDVIYRLEDDIQNIEISHEKKIRDLLTEDQRAIFDSYYGYGQNPYDRGGFGRGYFKRGLRGNRGGNYGYGRYRYGAGMGRNYLGRGDGRLYRGNYGFRQNDLRGYGMNRHNFRLGAGRLSGPNNYRYFQRFRCGRGPCGAGMSKWYRWDYGRGRWKWND